MSKEHEALKEIARKILIDMGYLSTEIKEEYWVQPHSAYSGENNSLHGFRVDVVGLKPDKKVAIECGKTPGEKIAALKIFFDEVIILPYFTLNIEKTDLERLVREKNETILKQGNRIKELEQELNQIISERNFFDQKLFTITRDWMEMIHRTIQHGSFFYSCYYNKTDIEVIGELTTQINELKERIQKKAEQDKAQHELAVSR